MEPVGIPPFHPIGFVTSVFKAKNGTPRQPSISSCSRGSITILQNVYTNPAHSLDGLEKFSHVWIIFVFHQNVQPFTKAKVRPPRLDGAKVGVFSTRSPHRSNSIGLSLAKIEAIEGSTLYLSGIDMVDGTPVLDIKPFIQSHDCPPELPQPAQPLPYNRVEQECAIQKEKSPVTGKTGAADAQSHLADENSSYIALQNKEPPGWSLNKDRELHPAAAEGGATLEPSWIQQPPIANLTVTFTPRALNQLQRFSASAEDPHYKLELMGDPGSCRRAIEDILAADPRSVYRRKACRDSLYYFTVDRVHVTCWFDEPHVEVVKVQPVSLCDHLRSSKPGTDTTQLTGTLTD